MNRIILLLVTLLGFGNIAYSQNTSNPIFERDAETTGYRGFVELGYTLGVGDYSMGRAEFLTSHGYQLSPYLFLGAGTGVHYYHTNGADDFVIPVFMDFRANILKGANVPFIGFKAGYTFGLRYPYEDGMGTYIAPTAGIKFMTSAKRSVYLSLGYTLQYGGYFGFSDKVEFGGFSMKIGYEF
ncbi:hypothetical protein M2137_001480 [Parabacteroides sp. PFB2-10]|uniref:hypothetical protein n=1 Tax=Parabacteroides sp. PFB2-10 TaxID=1742405 RepID=UPI00247490AC|nr:hypothetical protein [Parabacteroides sp. PFB2-10]MDH6312705.1 hypothetical protein [Parabacteroides sp. PFB2-10]